MGRRKVPARAFTRTFILAICIALASFASSAQVTKTAKPQVKKAPAKTTSASSGQKSAPARSASSVKPRPQTKVDDKTEFEKIGAISDVGEKIKALKKFLSSFPNSGLYPQAAEL